MRVRAARLLLFTRGERLMQQPFDLDRFEVTGEATPVVEQVLSTRASGAAISRSRRMAYWHFDRAAISETSLPGSIEREADRNGRRLRATIERRTSRPTGDVLPTAMSAVRDIWILDLARKTSSRFTTGPGTETAPVWFPDGAKIAYASTRAGCSRRMSPALGPSAALKQVVDGPDQVSPDGQWVLYFAVSPGETQDIFVLPTSGERTPRASRANPISRCRAAILARRALAGLRVDRDGRNEIYVQPFPPTGRGGRSRAAAAASRSGVRMERSCSSSATTDDSMRSTYPTIASIRIRRPTVPVRNARQRLQLAEQLHPQPRRPALSGEHAPRGRRRPINVVHNWQVTLK